MATVYIVTAGTHSSYQIEGAFDNRQDADAMVAGMRAADYPDCYSAQVEEYELGEMAGQAWEPIYECWLHDDGQIQEWRRPSYSMSCRWLRPGQRSGEDGEGWNEPVYRDGKDRRRFRKFWSAVSMDHAVKVAAEAWQAHLRETAIGLPG